MAFGGLRTTFKNSAVSIGTSLAATGSQAVRLGDLIFVVGGEQTALTITGVTDNLGNSYTSCNNTVNDAGTSTGRAFWARVKDDGTLTTVTIACNGGTNNGVIVVAIIEGPITTIDADPANITSDIASPFVCPTTGTLAQANEIVVGFLVGTGSTVNTATAPNLLADQQATAAILHATIGYQAVTVTTAVTPTFAAGSNPTDQLMGVASFRRDDTPLGAGKRLGMQWLPTPTGLASPASFQIQVEPLNLPLFIGAPFRPPAWPVPASAAQPSGLTWTEPGLSLFSEVPVTYLPSVAVWGPPPPDVRHPNVLQTWANELNLPLNVPPDAPFGKRDWSLPQGFATKGGAWINPAIQAVVTPPDTTNLPSTTSGWYVPPLVPQTLSYVRSKSIALEAVIQLPFNKTSWPNPRASKRSNALLTWSNGLPPLQFVLRAPLIARHNEQSWHVALKPQFVNLLPFAPPPVVEPPDTTNLPSVATSWTIPAGLPPLNQSFTRPLSLPLNVVAEALPSGKSVWVNPKDAQRPQALSFTLAYSLPLNTVVPVPFNQLSWPNPRAPERSAAHRGWVYSAPPLPDLIVYPSAVSSWPVPRGLRPLHLQILIGNSQICLNPPEVVVPPEPDFPPHPPPTDSGGAGIKSGVWKPGQKGKRPNYRSYRFITEKEIEQLTGREIRQSARDLRADVRKDPLASEIAKEIAALSRIVDYLADADRLEASVAELSRAIEYARRARAEAEADDEEVSFLLLS